MRWKRLPPSLQLWNAPGEYAREKSWDTKIHEFILRSRLHLLDGDIRQQKLTILVAVTAVQLAFGAVRIGAASALVVFRTPI
jgi:hypothetical protein